MHHLQHQSLLWIVVLLLTACGSKQDQAQKDQSLLPMSNGEAGELMIVMDSAKWQGKAGQALKQVFQDTFPQLPRTEPWFDLKHVTPQQANEFIKEYRNLVYVTTLSGKSYARNYFSDESLERIRQNPDLYKYTAQNVDARQQQVLYLFGQDEATLINNLQQHASELRSFMKTRELERLQQNMREGKRNQKAEQALHEKHQISLCIPEDFQIAKNSRNFCWLRYPAANTDQNIMMARQPYTNRSQFDSAQLLEWRDSLGRHHIFGSGQPDTSSYMMRQHYMPPLIRKTSFNGQYAKEVRGLWKLKNNTMGGPFVGYALTDPGHKRLFYLEGFVYAPGQSKRKFIWKLEALLKTFKATTTN